MPSGLSSVIFLSGSDFCRCVKRKRQSSLQPHVFFALTKEKHRVGFSLLSLPKPKPHTQHHSESKNQDTPPWFCLLHLLLQSLSPLVTPWLPRSEFSSFFQFPRNPESQTKSSSTARVRNRKCKNLGASASFRASSFFPMPPRHPESQTKSSSTPTLRRCRNLGAPFFPDFATLTSHCPRLTCGELLLF